MKIQSRHDQNEVYSNSFFQKMVQRCEEVTADPLHNDGDYVYTPANFFKTGAALLEEADAQNKVLEEQLILSQQNYDVLAAEHTKLFNMNAALMDESLNKATVIEKYQDANCDLRNEMSKMHGIICRLAARLDEPVSATLDILVELTGK
jgi:hypothetical protein